MKKQRPKKEGKGTERTKEVIKNGAFVEHLQRRKLVRGLSKMRHGGDEAADHSEVQCVL